MTPNSARTEKIRRLFNRSSERELTLQVYRTPRVLRGELTAERFYLLARDLVLGLGLAISSVKQHEAHHHEDRERDECHDNDRHKSPLALACAKVTLRSVMSLTGSCAGPIIRAANPYRSRSDTSRPASAVVRRLR